MDDLRRTESGFEDNSVNVFEDRSAVCFKNQSEVKFENGSEFDFEDKVEVNFEDGSREEYSQVHLGLYRAYTDQHLQQEIHLDL